MCLEMVIAVALRNRDRLLVIWPHVHELLSPILAPSQVCCKALDRRAESQEAVMSMAGCTDLACGLVQPVCIARSQNEQMVVLPAKQSNSKEEVNLASTKSIPL